MSLQRIRDLRLRGQKPKGVVTVLLGTKPRWLDDGPGLVVVRATDDPRFMDWRPLVGLFVAVIAAQVEPDRMLATLDGLSAVGVRFFGIADPTGFYPLLVGANDAHRESLRKEWEALCR